MAMPSALEIVCLYLYGQKSPPVNLKDDSLIRPEGSGDVPEIIDVNEYMTSGAGRFVKVENFKYVRNFLAGNDYLPLSAGTYSTEELLTAYGLSGKEFGVRSQVFTPP